MEELTGYYYYYYFHVQRIFFCHARLSRGGISKNHTFLAAFPVCGVDFLTSNAGGAVVGSQWSRGCPS
jgi:hypothetical protein